MSNIIHLIIFRLKLFKVFCWTIFTPKFPITFFTTKSGFEKLSTLKFYVKHHLPRNLLSNIIQPKIWCQVLFTLNSDVKYSSLNLIFKFIHLKNMSTKVFVVVFCRVIFTPKFTVIIIQLKSTVKHYSPRNLTTYTPKSSVKHYSLQNLFQNIHLKIYRQKLVTSKSTVKHCSPRSLQSKIIGHKITCL